MSYHKIPSEKGKVLRVLDFFKYRFQKNRLITWNGGHAPNPHAKVQLWPQGSQGTHWPQSQIWPVQSKKKMIGERIIKIVFYYQKYRRLRNIRLSSNRIPGNRDRSMTSWNKFASLKIQVQVWKFQILWIFHIVLDIFDFYDVFQLSSSIPVFFYAMNLL